MGVPKFYRWLSERYPTLSQVVNDSQVRIRKFDCFVGREILLFPLIRKFSFLCQKMFMIVSPLSDALLCRLWRNINRFNWNELKNKFCLIPDSRVRQSLPGHERNHSQLFASERWRHHVSDKRRANVPGYICVYWGAFVLLFCLFVGFTIHI